jgi:hypothetical protein
MSQSRFIFRSFGKGDRAINRQAPDFVQHHLQDKDLGVEMRSLSTAKTSNQGIHYREKFLIYGLLLE